MTRFLLWIYDSTSNYENWSYDRVLANTYLWGYDGWLWHWVYCTLPSSLGNMIIVISSSIAIYQTGSRDGKVPGARWQSCLMPTLLVWAELLSCLAILLSWVLSVACFDYNLFWEVETNYVDSSGIGMLQQGSTVFLCTASTFKFHHVQFYLGVRDPNSVY